MGMKFWQLRYCHQSQASAQPPKIHLFDPEAKKQPRIILKKKHRRRVRKGLFYHREATGSLYLTGDNHGVVLKGNRYSMRLSHTCPSQSTHNCSTFDPFSPPVLEKWDQAVVQAVASLVLQGVLPCCINGSLQGKQHLYVASWLWWQGREEFILQGKMPYKT